MHVMHRQQVGADGFLGGDVVDICARDAEAAQGRGAAAGAGAGGEDGREVGCVGGVAEVEGPGGSDGVAEALGRGVLAIGFQMSRVGFCFVRWEGKGLMWEGGVAEHEGRGH